jgi:hypothetical protein
LTTDPTVNDSLFEGKSPLSHIAAGNSKDVSLLIGATYCEASMLWGLIPKKPVIHQLLSYIFAKAVPAMVLPPAIRGCGGQPDMNSAALKAASAELVRGFGEVAQERLREEREFSGSLKQGDVPVSTAWTGTGESDGMMQALSYLFGCGGVACNEFIQAQASVTDNIYIYELKLNDSESPKLRNGHVMDLPLLFTMDDDREKRWMDGAVWGRSEGRGAGMDTLASGMQECWANFARAGSPGKFNGMDWPKFPAGAILSTPREIGVSFGPSVQKQCKYAAGSLETVLWKNAIEKGRAVGNAQKSGGVGKLAVVAAVTIGAVSAAILAKKIAS